MGSAVVCHEEFSDSSGESVFYIGPNKHIYHLYGSNGSWSAGDMYVNWGAPLAITGSSLTSFSDGAGESVFYIGTNQHVYHLYATGGRWAAGDMTVNWGAPLAGTGTGLASFSDGAGESVFYAGTNEHIYHLYATNGRWSPGDMTNTWGAPLAITGSAFEAYSDGPDNYCGSGGEHVFYSGQNHLEVLLGLNGTWSNTIIAGLIVTPLSGAGCYDNSGRGILWYETVNYVNGSSIYQSSYVPNQWSISTDISINPNTGNSFPLVGTGSGLLTFIDK